NIDTVWFGAAAPLALMGKAAKQAGSKKLWPPLTVMKRGGPCCPGRAKLCGSSVITLIASPISRSTRCSAVTKLLVHSLNGCICPRRFRLAHFRQQQKTRVRQKSTLGLSMPPRLPLSSAFPGWFRAKARTSFYAPCRLSEDKYQTLSF